MRKNLTFPLVVGATALCVYGQTLNRGVTLTSLPFTSEILGWEWKPMTGHPFTWLLTLPLRLLPETWIPFALNLFSAVTAASVLGILARSVAIFPWDCPPDAKKSWSLRLPVLLACALCGFEFNFWQDATAMTGEMLELLLFAAVIACALEFRVRRNERWLDAAAVIWGFGLAENWAMQLTLPFFLVALAWLPGLKIIGRRFFFRLILMGFAGIFIFSLLPLAQGLSGRSSWSVSEVWWSALHQAKQNLPTLYYGFWSWHRLLTMVLLLYFFLPVLAFLMRIKNEGSANIFGVEWLQVQIFRALRAGLLVACIWLLFDPEMGPRKIILKEFGIPLPLLTFDYLLALATGFLAGSLLFASQAPPREFLVSAAEKFGDFFRRHAFALIAAFSALAVAGLLWRSGFGIFYSQRPALAAGGDLIVRSLPAEGGVLLGDDAGLLRMVKASLVRQGIHQWPTVDLQQLPAPKYRAQLEAGFPWGWTTNGTRTLSPADMLVLLNGMARTHRIFYLVPEPGHFLFEQFYPQPQGGAHELKKYPEDAFAPPLLDASQIISNEQFWDAAWDNNLSAVSRIAPSAKKIFQRHFGISPVVPDLTRQLGRWHSIALNNWGVELQRNGKFLEAKQRFEQAQFLNPENPAVAANLFCNSNLLAGKTLGLSGAASLTKSVSGIPQLARLIQNFGAFDEPSVYLLLGNACFNAGWTRQALQQLDRARTLAPDAGTPELALAKIYSRIGGDREVIGLVKKIRRFETNSPAGRALGVELSVLEAKSWFALTNAPEARRVLENVLQNNPGDPAVLETVFQVYLVSGSAANALELLDRMLAETPHNIAALNNKAALLIQLQRAAEAVPILDHALTLTNLPAMRLNRAIALLQAKDFVAAEKAYLNLQTAAVDQFSVEYGLAQIAEARQDTNAAVIFYSKCLTNAAPESLKWRDAKARLRSLKPTGK